MQNIESIPISISAGWATKTLMKQKMSELYVEAENHMYSKKLSESQSMRNQTIRVILKTLK